MNCYVNFLFQFDKENNPQNNMQQKDLPMNGIHKGLPSRLRIDRNKI
jgi:hypothetical protein